MRAKRVKFGELWRVGEFRSLWIAETGSVFGDQLARVALSLLVFAQTSSALLTGLTYALTFVPAVLGGLLLSGLADRYPRRRVIIAADLVRAALAASMAIPGLPLGVLWGLIGLLTLANAPFKAAQLAILPQILQDSRYSAALALRQISSQTAQVAGFALGGVLVTALTPHGALLVNAATFVASAVLVTAGVRIRPAPRQDTHSSVDSPSATLPGSGRLIPIFIAVALTGLWVVPEGLAAPYAGVLGAAAFAVGVLMAADPLGSVLGAWLAAARPNPTPSLRSVMLPAFAAGIPLIACAARPGLLVSAALWAISGAFSTIFLVRMQEYVTQMVADSRRGTVMGRISACLYTSQGVAILGGGALADTAGPFVAVSVAGALATAIVALLMLVWRRARPPHHPADEQQPNDDDKPADQISLLRIAPSGVRRDGPDADGDDNAGAPTPENGSVTSMSAGKTEKQPPHRGGVLNVRGWELWANPPGGALFLTLVDAVAISLAAVAFVVAPPTRTDVLIAAGLCVLGLGAAEVSIRVEQMRRWLSDAPRTPHVNLTSVWTMAAALVLHPGVAAVVVLILYSHLWIRIWRHLSQVQTYRWLFNVANVVVCCQITAWFVEAVTPLGPPGTAIELLWLAAAIAVYFVVNSVLAAVAIATLQSDWSLRRLLGNFDDNSLELATLCMGALVALLLGWKPWLAPLVLLPMYRLHRSVLTQDYEIAATMDGKTGVLNAVSWNVRAKKELDRARRHGASLSILMIDIDHFKRANNKHGHLVGDRALRAVAKTLQQATRSYDCVGRFGGDEFSVLLTATGREAAKDVGNRICENIRKLHIDTESGLQRLSVSIGIATYPHHGDTLEDLLKSADVALFAAKDSGRDRVRSFESA
ncbi:GGDEF domain-containing diguanylate cyclase [Kibdelosporangium sp. 4NS15]|uniref:GGDEF domain-containing diguanylate cyclase n=1 Tax=Kibdelosporangium persicum TaxID=2698649 RepID=A0ABX2FCW3_9PSEU|nr:GGDEF domain-containing diguanylate cyclase [Kibdelosporangium persicum]